MFNQSDYYKWTLMINLIDFFINYNYRSIC